MSTAVGQNRIITEGLVFCMDQSSPRSYPGLPKKNFYTNGHFAGGAGVPGSSYYPNTALIVKMRNPGASEYCLRLTSYQGDPGAAGDTFTNVASESAQYTLVTTGTLKPNTTYCMSCWYAKSADYAGTAAIFHSRWYRIYNHAEVNTTPVTDGNLIETKVINGLTWERRYYTFTTNAYCANGNHYWYVGWRAGSVGVKGYRYFTNLQLEEGDYPTPYMAQSRDGVNDLAGITRFTPMNAVPSRVINSTTGDTVRCNVYFQNMGYQTTSWNGVTDPATAVTNGVDDSDTVWSPTALGGLGHVAITGDITDVNGYWVNSCYESRYSGNYTQFSLYLSRVGDIVPEITSADWLEELQINNTVKKITDSDFSAFYNWGSSFLWVWTGPFNTYDGQYQMITDWRPGANPNSLYVKIKRHRPSITSLIVPNNPDSKADNIQASVVFKPTNSVTYSTGVTGKGYHENSYYIDENLPFEVPPFVLRGAIYGDIDGHRVLECHERYNGNTTKFTLSLAGYFNTSYISKIQIKSPASKGSWKTYTVNGSNLTIYDPEENKTFNFAMNRLVIKDDEGYDTSDSRTQWVFTRTDGYSFVDYWEQDNYVIQTGARYEIKLTVNRSKDNMYDDNGYPADAARTPCYGTNPEAFTFSGNDYLQLDGTVPLPSGNRPSTILVWCRPEYHAHDLSMPKADYSGLVSYGNRNSSDSRLLALNTTYSESHGAGLRNAYWSNDYVPDIQVPYFQWSYVAMVTKAESPNTILYRLGKNQATLATMAKSSGTSAGGTGINTQAKNLTIGCTDLAGGRPFVGKIGAVQIYERALSDQEIFNNFQAQRSRYGI